MDPISGAAMIGAAGVTSAASYFGQQSANRANRREAGKQRKWQEQMSNTSYQRARADMEAAGINPLMAVNNGGAGTPGGAMATMQDEMGPAGRAGVSSALDTRRAYAELRNLSEQNNNLKAQNKKLKADTQLSIAQRGSVLEDTANKMYGNVGAKVESLIDQTKQGQIARFAQRFNPFINSAAKFKP